MPHEVFWYFSGEGVSLEVTIALSSLPFSWCTCSKSLLSTTERLFHFRCADTEIWNLSAYDLGKGKMVSCHGSRFLKSTLTVCMNSCPTRKVGGKDGY